MITAMVNVGGQRVMIRPVRPSDHPFWARLRAALWPGEPPDSLAADLAGIVDNPAVAVFVAECDDVLCGFVEVSVRPGAEGCATTGLVGYIEGWYVAPERRRHGLGRALVRAAEDWAASRGCRWMGSDALVDNALSHAAHVAIGFRDVGSLTHYVKPMDVASASARGVTLTVLPCAYSVVQLPPGEPWPVWGDGPFVSITRTEGELSVVCRSEAVPPDERQEPGWRCLRVAGPLDFALVGALASLTGSLAAAGISVFALSTFDTDYLLVRESTLDRAAIALRKAGHRVEEYKLPAR